MSDSASLDTDRTHKSSQPMLGLFEGLRTNEYSRARVTPKEPRQPLNAEAGIKIQARLQGEDIRREMQISQSRRVCVKAGIAKEVSTFDVQGGDSRWFENRKASRGRVRESQSSR